MTKRRSSPRITLDLTEEIIQNATRAHSSACIIADAISAQVRGATRVSVDLATIAWTDQRAGVRYTYLTPDSGRVALFALDRGVTPPPQKLTLQRAIRVSPIKLGVSKAEQRAKRLAELKAKAESGVLTATERRALTTMERSPKRAISRGRATVADDGTVIGGTRPHQGGTAAKRGVVRELLPANVRVFGARIANYSDLDELLDAARDEGRAQAEAERRDR